MDDDYFDRYEFGDGSFNDDDLDDFDDDSYYGWNNDQSDWENEFENLDNPVEETLNDITDELEHLVAIGYIKKVNDSKTGTEGYTITPKGMEWLYNREHRN